MPMTFDYEKTNALSKALGGRVELLQELIKLRKADLSYSQIQDIVKSGLAEDYFDLGDEIMTKYTATDETVYDFPWIVVDFRNVYFENDPNPHPGMVLQSKYATIEELDWAQDNLIDLDENETVAEEGWYYFRTNSDKEHASYIALETGDSLPLSDWQTIYKTRFTSTGVSIYGTNDYIYSQVRQWLNSDAEAGGWWEAPYPTAKTPTELNTYNGFAHGFDSDFLDIIKKTRLLVRRSYQANLPPEYTYERFYVPSLIEFYLVDKDFSLKGTLLDPGEDEFFAYYTKILNNNGFNKPTALSSSPKHKRSLLNDHSIDVKIFTRSTPGLFYMLPLVETGGIQGYGQLKGAFKTLHISPCCVIS